MGGPAGQAFKFTFDRDRLHDNRIIHMVVDARAAAGHKLQGLRSIHDAHQWCSGAVASSRCWGESLARWLARPELRCGWHGCVRPLCFVVAPGLDLTGAVARRGACLTGWAACGHRQCSWQPRVAISPPHFAPRRREQSGPGACAFGRGKLHTPAQPVLHGGPTESLALDSEVARCWRSSRAMAEVNGIGPAAGAMEFVEVGDVLPDPDDPDEVHGMCDTDSGGESIGDPPPLAPCPEGVDPFSIWPNRRFDTIGAADFALAIWFNRAKKRLVRVRTRKSSAVFRCGNDNCDFEVMVVHDHAAEADFGHMDEQAAAAFTFCRVKTPHAAPDVCKAIPQAQRVTRTNRQNGASMP